jgi:hypothetical protein
LFRKISLFQNTRKNFGGKKFAEQKRLVLIILTSHGQPAALEALQCGPSTDSEKRYFGAKSIRSLEKTQILALKMAIFQKWGP